MPNSNYGNYSQPNPWSLSLPNKQKQSKKKEIPKNDETNGLCSTFRTASQAMYYNQMLAGKSGKKFLDQYQLSQNGSEIKIVPKENSQIKNSINPSNSRPSSNNVYDSRPNYQPDPQPTTKRLGLSNVTSKFKNPMITNNNNGYSSSNYNSATSTNIYSSSTSNLNSNKTNSTSNNINPFNNQSNELSNECLEILTDERAKNLDKNIIEKILNEIVGKKSNLDWKQIGGLRKVKEELEEMVILPMKRPDIFIDLLMPCKGLLLFGPPGL